MRRLIIGCFAIFFVLAAHGAETMTATLILVPELTACGRSYTDERPCRDATLVTARRWARQYAHMTTELQPGDNAITLAEPFFEKLKRLCSYESFPSDPRRRWAMVIIFSVSPAPPEVMTLERQETPLIDGATTQIRIGASGSGLTHQRADAFRPSRDVEWNLKAGNHNYHFWTEKP